MAMHTLNASSVGVVSCLGSTTVHTGVCSWDQIGCMSLTVPVISVYAYTLHTRYKGVAMYRFRLMIHI